LREILHFYCITKFHNYLIYNLIIKLLHTMSLSTLPRTILIISILLATISVKSVSAQESQDTLKILFVGNSYIHVKNLPEMVSLISEETSTKLLTEKSTIGGARLSEHWNGQRGLKTKNLIRDGGFDIVVLQNQSMAAIETPDSLMKYAGLFCDYIRKNGAKPYLYVTWAREKVPQFQEEINKVYLAAADAYNATPVMAGDAWALAQAYRPQIQLFATDGSHPADLGAYLTASLFVKELSGDLPDKMPMLCTVDSDTDKPVFLMYVDFLDGVFIKKVAEEISGEKQ